MFGSDAFSYVNLLDKTMDVSFQREAIIANNIANNDTPGYKRKDIEFESVLQDALFNSKARSLDKAVAAIQGDDLSGIMYTNYENYSYRIDGNNVDMDTENVELASEQLRYNTLTTSVSNQFNRFNMVSRS